MTKTEYREKIKEAVKLIMSSDRYTSIHDSFYKRAEYLSNEEDAEIGANQLYLRSIGLAHVDIFSEFELDKKKNNSNLCITDFVYLTYVDTDANSVKQ